MKIKFIGDFKDLIPMGFTFHKLFARNYKVYEKDKVWIWVAHGGYVEISDHHNYSGYIAKMIIDGTFPLHEEDKDYKIFIVKKGQPKPCMINKKTGKIQESIILMRSVGGHDKWIEMPDYDDYKDVFLLQETIETIKKLAEKRMIQIKE